MGFKIWSKENTYSVGIYSRAGAGPTYLYNLYWSIDEEVWNLAASNQSSTTCALKTTVDVPASYGIIYIYAYSPDNDGDILIRGSNSTICPGNVGGVCTYSASISGNEDIGITVIVDENSNYVTCTILAPV